MVVKGLKGTGIMVFWKKKTSTVPKGFEFVRIVSTEFLQAIRKIRVHVYVFCRQTVVM